MTHDPLFDLPNTFRAFYGAFAHLHDIQIEAIEPILEGRDLILQSATGTGKTEAVLAPCLETVIRSGRNRAVLYIVPTRALALDLMRRLDPVLSERLGLALSVRTGDLKREGGGRPDLVLTTPESLDVMLGSPNRDLSHLIRRIGTVIIDEIHPLVYQYRGRQLSYLLRRLERRRGATLQKIALSATIADADSIIGFFGFRPDAVKLVTTVQREIVPHLVHLKNDEDELVALIDDLYEKWGYRKILLFANSRGRCDRLFAVLSRRGRFKNVCELHYSNLKTRERREVEERFRKRSHALCIATSTLELGIDVGDVDGVILFEPTDSVSAFLQRIGRSNRRLKSTQFWGVCRGERAGSQLLRFLGLLRLARAGTVEAPRPKELPSVLIQQILSCLYEKKRISLPALLDLFPEQKPILGALFISLEEQGWLREDSTLGYKHTYGAGKRNRILRGGWRYRDCLLDRKVWSNFPEAEEEYSLDLSGEAVADLPKSIVRQLDPGDRVYVAGKRIQVLEIDESTEKKRVLAKPAEKLDEKELYWLGSGSQVSYETARSIREVLGEPSETLDLASLGLFSRTRKLLHEELERAKPGAVLANGIGVSRGPTGIFRYWTFLGSIANLMIGWAAEDALKAEPSSPDSEAAEIFVSSDETAVESSEPLDFRKLYLPLDRNALKLWVRENIKSIRPLFSLNSFCDALPPSLLAEELTDFLFDSRICEAFKRLVTESSEIAAGDRAFFETRWVEPQETPRSKVVLARSEGSEPLLEWEKRRWDAAALPRLPAKTALLSIPEKSCRLTGTIIGDYIRHNQCSRWLQFTFLPNDLKPPRRALVDTELGALRTQSGRSHEKRVLDFLKNRSEELIEIAQSGEGVEFRPLRERFMESIERLGYLMEKAKASSSKALYLAQPVFMVKNPAGREPGRGTVDGVGIPDLVAVSMTKRGPLLEVGDIKDSPAPHYSQKWQVAFYALLLMELVRSGEIEAEVAKSGFIVTRPILHEAEPTFHTFDLEPFLASFPSLLENMESALKDSSNDTACRLGEHSTGCAWFEYCYRQGLGREDILFLPQLSEGALEKLRSLGIKTVEAASGQALGQAGRAECRNGTSLELSSRQKERIEGRIEALGTNRIILSKKKTRLYPANISIPVFLHILKDPISGLPRITGLRVPKTLHSARSEGTFAWTILSEKDLRSCRESFLKKFMSIWKGAIEQDRGPHLFHFGKQSLELLFEWGKEAGGKNPLSFLFEWGIGHTTDLRRLVLDQFDFPAPGTLSLFSIGRILGFTPELDEPESLFHTEDAHFVSPEEWMQDETTRLKWTKRIEAVLELQEKTWNWAQAHLESDLFLTREEWEPLKGAQVSPGAAYLRFLDEEKRLHEEDVSALQELPLAERVERFRAIGPMLFEHSLLDHEGRFLYRFKMAEEGRTGFSKFREGDFLKLSPIGSPDIQSGFPVILREYDRKQGRVSVVSKQGRLALGRRLAYSLEEDLADWNGPKLAHVVRTVFPDPEEQFFEPDQPNFLARLLQGGLPTGGSRDDLEWIKGWISSNEAGFGLNERQKQALELPFRYSPGVIEGPPGTGKTHLLGWILIALICRAREAGEPLRIAVSALTHQAIDQVLGKVVELVNRHYGNLQGFSARCLKWGRFKEEEENAHTGNLGENSKMRVGQLTGPDEIFRSRHIIIGATGYGLYQLFESRRGEFPRIFDWVIFDEASQVPVPYTLLSLIYGKGNFLFIGDEKQLPPIVRGTYGQNHGSATEPEAPGRSILSHMIERYGPEIHVRLDETYRMNRELCAFPSKMWYEGALRSAPANAGARLVLSAEDGAITRSFDYFDRILDPEKPAVLVLSNHRGCHEKSPAEVEIVSELACRLIARYGIEPNRMALISPHRAQNNAIADHLAGLLSERGIDIDLPLIDTVERVQGAERDIVFFSLTTSDPDHIMSDFLNNPNRFNVAITRARLKLIVVGSRAFFGAVANSEEELAANRPFKEFAAFCRERGSVFNYASS